MRRIPAVHLVDILVYVVVIGLCVQVFPSVISESFAVTLATAVLLKLVLEVVVLAKNAAIRRLKVASTTARKVTSLLALLVVGPGSKLLVLELTDLVLGDRVHLGGFFQVTALVIVLVLARSLVRRAVDPGAPSAVVHPR